ncbi:MAG: fumarylacetoacetate hydrolase family protein [Gemmatimonadetes bacterium]|nr:fumarylacetoacetate hydrolase family protein [Gemmatimonadota bacterium]
MNPKIRHPLLAMAAILTTSSSACAQADVTSYVRYGSADGPRYGVVADGLIHDLSAAPWSGGQATGTTIPFEGADLLAPVQPGKVIAVGLNYRSHLGGREPSEYPGLFAKFPSAIVGPGADIVLPPDSENVHYEGELVLVIGKTAKAVSQEDARSHIFGVTAGNDVSERNWQAADLQWFRAKASDTFGPVGPVVVAGLDSDALLVQTRLNGEVRQSESSADLIFDTSQIVSYVSQYVTLEPGDIIFTGTPGTTAAMQAGDVVEIEVEGVGVLRNTVVASNN